MLIAISLLTLLSACDRTGYHTSDQENRINMLTGTEWVVESIKYSDNSTHTSAYQDHIYKFDRNGRGSEKVLHSLSDPKLKDVTFYFQWTFTNENFAVICMLNTGSEFWLIDRLTPTELCVYAAVQDPVLHPSIPQTYYKLKARRIQP